MNTPFAIQSKPKLLQSLEAECAARYSSQAHLLEEIIAENRLLRLQRDQARNALTGLIDMIESYRPDFAETFSAAFALAKDALK